MQDKSICNYPRCTCKATGMFCSLKPGVKGKKRVNRISEKGRLKAHAKHSKVMDDMTFYITEVWAVRPHVCECCETPLPSVPDMRFFHHILPKRDNGGYPEYRRSVWNIALIATVCHNAWEESPDNRPNITRAYECLLDLHDREALDAESPYLIINWNNIRTHSGIIIYDNPESHNLF